MPMLRAVPVVLLLSGLPGLAGAADSCIPLKARRGVCPWIVYTGEGTIDLLRKQADIIGMVSVCGPANREFVSRCHELGIEVYLLVGGEDGTVFDTPERRREVIEGYLRRCQDAGFDGIDLDYEGVDNQHKEGYSAFLRETAAALHGAGKRMSMCVSYIMSTYRTAGETGPGIGGIDWYDPQVVGEACDLVRVMCYDMYSLSGKGIGPVSTYPWAREAMAYWSRFVPRDRLIMGLPAYSRDFALRLDGRVQSPEAPRPEVPEGTEVRRVWLPWEQISTYQYEDMEGVLHLFFATDDTSTRAHLQTADELDLGGIGFWHYGAVTPDMWAVVRQWLAETP